MWSNKEPSNRYDWDNLKQSIIFHGLRNSLLVAPMPTASTSQILGYNECFEPITSNVLKSYDTNVSNYVGITSNVLKSYVDTNDTNVSNYVRITSNILFNDYSNLIANITTTGGGSSTGSLSYWKTITSTTNNSIYYGAPVKIGGNHGIDVNNDYILTLS